MRVEILTDPAAAERGRKIIDAMIASAPLPVTVGTSYVGTSDVLMMYGNGHPVRRQWWMQHLARGGRCVGWDLGYWRHKDENTCRMRLTIDADHPQRMLRPEPPERWDAEGITLRHDSNVMGPILLVGMGRKAQGVHGMPAQAWEKDALRRIRAAQQLRDRVPAPHHPSPGSIPEHRHLIARYPALGPNVGIMLRQRPRRGHHHRHHHQGLLHLTPSLPASPSPCLAGRGQG